MPAPAGYFTESIMVTLEQAKEYLRAVELPFPILFFRLSSTGQQHSGVSRCALSGIDSSADSALSAGAYGARAGG